jgi:uncharacterized membrane protein
MSEKTLEKKISWHELDILRGLAALFMIINHGGYEILIPDLATHGISGFIIFISSSAPVLFFFITGVGYGLQSGQTIKPNYWSDVIYKVIILILADQFFFWKKGELIGLDFLGFIAFSTLVMAGIRVTKKPLFYAIIGFIAVFVLRYLVGPYLDDSGIQVSSIVTWVIGTKGLSNISYPLSPWLAYPFLGYIVGVGVIQYQKKLEFERFNIIVKLLLFSLVPTIGSLLLWYKGASFFRWGTVSLGFYLSSFAILLVSLAFSLLIKLSPSTQFYQQSLSLRGVASLAVVPIHYTLIALATFIGIKNLNFLMFAFVITIIVALSFFFSHQVNFWSYWASQSQNHATWRWIILVLSSLAVVLTIFYGKTSSLSGTLLASFGQILLCFLLIVRR